MADALNRAWHEHEWVPKGWERIFRDTVRNLIAARTPDRDLSLLTMSVETTDGALEIDMLSHDRVLGGIMPKCLQRSKATCSQCGRRGLPRQLGGCEVDVLCASCGAPRILKRAIDDALSLVGLATAGNREVDAFLVPEALRAHFIRSAAARNCAAGAASDPKMSPSEYRRWVATLHDIRRTISAPT